MVRTLFGETSCRLLWDMQLQISRPSTFVNSCLFSFASHSTLLLLLVFEAII